MSSGFTVQPWPSFQLSLLSLLLSVILPFNTFGCILTHLQQMTYENLVAKGEIAHDYGKTNVAIFYVKYIDSITKTWTKKVNICSIIEINVLNEIYT